MHGAVISAMTAEVLGAAEIEPAAVGVDVGEVDVVEVAGFDARLHGAVTVAVTADALRAAEIESAAIGVDVGEADAVEVAVEDRRLHAAMAVARPCAPPKLKAPPFVLTWDTSMPSKLLSKTADCTPPCRRRDPRDPERRRD